MSREFKFFMVQHAHQQIIMADLASLFNNAYVKVATMDKGISAFKATGIFPFNQDQFTAEDFEPAREFEELVVQDTEIQTVEPLTVSPPILRNEAGPAERILSPQPGTSAQALSPQFGTSAQALSPQPRPSEQANVSIQDIAPIPKFNVLD
ncbi:hypothetical protein M8J76_000829 [Diaphorina citri]|nr:hypothetical protein M8J76_000829 [Diaphorina citri]